MSVDQQGEREIGDWGGREGGREGGRDVPEQKSSMQPQNAWASSAQVRSQPSPYMSPWWE